PGKLHRRRRTDHPPDRSEHHRRAAVAVLLHHRPRDRRRDGRERPDRAAPEPREVAALSTNAGGEALRVEHVAKSFGAVTALVDVSLRLERGGGPGLSGDNAAGT